MPEVVHDHAQEIVVAQNRQDKNAAHAARIGRYEAMPEEVEDWHFSADPLNGALILALDIAAANNDKETHMAIRQEMMTEYMLTEAGGITLLASVLYPDVFDRARATGEPWIDSFRANPLRAVTLPQQLFDACHQRMLAEPLLVHAENGDRLLLAAEMIKAGAGALLTTLSTARGHGAEISEDTERLLLDKNNLAHHLLKIAAGQAQAITSENGPAEIVDRMRMRGLKAQMFYAATFMSVDFAERPDLQDAADGQFVELVCLIKHALCNFDDPITNRLNTNEVRGVLHEVLWFVDAYALRKLQPGAYGKVRVTPAMSQEDAPRVGHPSQKRGIDMRVRYGDLHDKIQLKSRGGRYSSGEDDYSGVIIKLCERNFQDVQPRRLLGKLNTYLRWAQSGFDPAMQPKVDRYVLETVRAEFADITSRPYDRTTQLRMGIADALVQSAMGTSFTPGPNRAERRRLAREQRRKKQK